MFKNILDGGGKMWLLIITCLAMAGWLICYALGIIFSSFEVFVYELILVLFLTFLVAIGILPGPE